MEKEKRHSIKIGELSLNLTSTEIRHAFIECGKFLLQEEDKMQEIFEETV